MSASSTDDRQVRDRLLQAWRGEIMAGRMYEAIANEREADILRRMADAESGHRRRDRRRRHVSRGPRAPNLTDALTPRRTLSPRDA